MGSKTAHTGRWLDLRVAASATRLADIHCRCAIRKFSNSRPADNRSRAELVTDPGITQKHLEERLLGQIEATDKCALAVLQIAFAPRVGCAMHDR